MLRLPCVVIEASDVPDASTRLRMIATAWFEVRLGDRRALGRDRPEDDLVATREVEPESRGPVRALGVRRHPQGEQRQTG